MRRLTLQNNITAKYEFEELEKLDKFKYHACDKINKKTQHLFYTSFVSRADDINSINFDKLQRHKNIIDMAIKMVEKQYLAGMREPMIIYPHELRKSYRFAVYKHVQSKVAQKNKTNEGARENCSQPYWVYQDKICCYEFRKKNLKSKFQCFVEFDSAYKPDNTIKMNLRMSKSAYENRQTFYKDGFDLVYEENSIKVRHVSELIVDKKVDNKIEKFVAIDSWANLHTILVDKNDTNVDSQGRPRFNIDRKVVCGLYNKHKSSTRAKRIINQVKKFDKPELYRKRLDVLIQSIKMHTSSIINTNDESKVILIVPSKSSCTSKMYAEMLDVFCDEVKLLCKKHGITLEVLERTYDEFKTTISKYKERTKQWAVKHKTVQNYKLSEHLTWTDVALCGLLFKYEDFYPILKKSGKFSEHILKNTDKTDGQVLEGMTFEMFKESWLDWSKQYPDEFSSDEATIIAAYKAHNESIQAQKEQHFEEESFI